MSNPFAGSSAIDELDPDVDPALPLGLTFSFPVEQTALNEGRILTWTKGFSAKNAVGNDVVRLLQDAFNRKHLHVRCVALVNDVSAHTYTWQNRFYLIVQTVGALLSRAYTAGGCILGVFAYCGAMFFPLTPRCLPYRRDFRYRYERRVRREGGEHYETG